MAVISFNEPVFRKTYPQFTCGKEYPTVALGAYFTAATAYITNNTFGCVSLNQQTLALNLMTAHLALLANNVANGQVGGVVTDATIDKVSVGLQPPPEKSQWQWWLNQTPYGQQLLALFQVETVGGFYVGASLDLAAFRRPARFL